MQPHFFLTFMYVTCVNLNVRHASNGKQGKVRPSRPHIKNRSYARLVPCISVTHAGKILQALHLVSLWPTKAKFCKPCILQGHNQRRQNFVSLAPATASRLCILFFCFFLKRGRKGKFFGVFYLHLYTNLSEQGLKPRSSDFV